MSPVIGTEYDELRDEVFKIYSDQSITVPVNAVMKKRHANHYLNINHRVANNIGRIKTGQEAVCFNQGLLGVMGYVKSCNAKKKSVKLQIDKDSEERKIHNAFLAENFLKRELFDKGLLA